MLGGLDEPWCRSCGSFGFEETERCPKCQIGLTPFDYGPDRVGLVVSVKSGLLHRPAICISFDSDEATLLSKGSELQQMGIEAFDQVEKIVTDDLMIQSAPGRLLQVVRASEEGDLKAKWDNDVIRDAAMNYAKSSLGCTRAAAFDWLKIGADTEARELGLTESEITWYEAHLSTQDDDASDAFVGMESLPADGYFAKVGLLLELMSHIVQSAELQSRSVALVRPFVDLSVVARALVAAFDDSSDDSRLAVAQDFTQSIKEGLPEGTELIRLIECVATNELERPTNPGELPLAMARSVYLEGIRGSNIDNVTSWLRPLTLAQFDDLIDAGSMTSVGVSSSPTVGNDLSYLRARTDPSLMSNDELREVKSLTELARRMFESADIAGLIALAPETEIAAHFEALLKVCDVDGGSDDRLRPEASDLLNEVNEFRTRIAQNPSGEIPDPILADPTCWRFLRAEARSGRIVLDPEQRKRSPLFASWLDLYEMQACVFANDWTKVRDLADDLLKNSADEHFRDEVLNLAAYAQYQLGNDRAALKMLTEALENDHTESLIVNASIVAASLGSEEAAKFLAWIYDESSNPEVGLKALLKGVDVWLADETSVALPDPITKSIRNALSRPLPDDAMLELLRVSSGQDREWLAGAPTISTMTENQSDLVSYWVATAQMMSPEHSGTLNEVTSTLISAKKKALVAPWVDREFSKLLDSISQMIHVPFGEAVYVTDTIKLLLASDLLSMATYVIFAVQAGTHLSAKFKDEGNTLSNEAEQLFLIRPLERFVAECDTLNESTRDDVEAELSRCQILSAFSMGLVASAETNQFAKAWDNLVARERVDFQNRSSILGQEARILNEYTKTVQRLANFRARIRQLKFDEDGRKMYKDLDSDIDTWIGLVNRLKSTL
jgi:hypothetical protein